MNDKKVPISMKRTQTLLDLGVMAATANSLDLDDAEGALRENPGPAFYKESIRVTIEYSRKMKEIRTRLGHQRAEAMAELAIEIGDVKGSA